MSQHVRSALTVSSPGLLWGLPYAQPPIRRLLSCPSHQPQGEGRPLWTLMTIHRAPVPPTRSRRWCRGASLDRTGPDATECRQPRSRKPRPTLGIQSAHLVAQSHSMMLRCPHPTSSTSQPHYLRTALEDGSNVSVEERGPTFPLMSEVGSGVTLCFPRISDEESL